MPNSFKPKAALLTESEPDIIMFFIGISVGIKVTTADGLQQQFYYTYGGSCVKKDFLRSIMCNCCLNSTFRVP